jgi:hypothetical protein
MGSPRLAHNRVPCMTGVSVDVSDTIILECCPRLEEVANAGPSSIDDQSSDHTARETPSLFPNSEGHHG